MLRDEHKKELWKKKQEITDCQQKQKVAEGERDEWQLMAESLKAEIERLKAELQKQKEEVKIRMLLKFQATTLPYQLWERGGHMRKNVLEQYREWKDRCWPQGSGSIIYWFKIVEIIYFINHETKIAAAVALGKIIVVNLVIYLWKEF